MVFFNFSIAIDASNKASKKMYPIVVHYFHIKKGIQNKLMDFCEDPDETSLKIFENIEQFMQRLNLNPEWLSVFSVDNASINFGIRDSVYQKCLENHTKKLK